MNDQLIAPHGGALVDLLAAPERAHELKTEAEHLPAWTLSHRQLCDLELLLTGGFSPLEGFMNRADYEGVRDEMRLKSGVLWPMPVTLDVTEQFAKGLAGQKRIALRDREGALLAVLTVEDVWKPDREAEAKAVFRTTSTAHAGVAYLLEQANPWYVGGRLEGVRLPAHYDFRPLRLTPAALRAEFARLGWKKIVAFQTRNPMHRAHQELTLRAAKRADANLLIHPSVGMTRPGDVEYYVRVRCYQAMLPSYPKNTVRLALLPLAMRMGGPREAVWHAIIRKNHGCTHFVVGRDHAGPGKDRDGKPFYGPYEAQELLRSKEQELGVTMVPFQMLVYLEAEDRYVPEPEVPAGARVLNISGTELRKRLAEGRDLPSWFTFPAVARELQKSYPPRNRQGVTIFLAGHSEAAKASVANVLRIKFLELGGRPVTLLDEDSLQKNLALQSGSSQEGTKPRVRSLAFVASEITKNGGIVICAPPASLDASRNEVRALVERCGGFVAVRLDSSAEADGGKVSESAALQGNQDDPTLTFSIGQTSSEEVAQGVLHHLQSEGYLAQDRAVEAASPHSSGR